MSKLRDLRLVDASVPETETFAVAVRQLFNEKVPGIGVVDAEGKLVGVLSERDVLRALFPRYLDELKHTAFLQDDLSSLQERATEVRNLPVSEFMHTPEPLAAEESETHAAERFLHTEEQALPVVDEETFLGMLSISALCRMRLDRSEKPPES